MITKTESDKKYFIRLFLLFGACVAVNAAAISGAFDGMKTRGIWSFSLIFAAPIFGNLWAVLAWMRDSDEILRALTTKCFIVVAGVAIAIASMWGFLEIYATAAHVSAAMIYPLFRIAFGAVSPFIRASN